MLPADLARFGLRIEKRSFKELGAAAKRFPDAAAEAAWRRRSTELAGCRQPARARRDEALPRARDDLDDDPAVRAMGINCLNESFFSDSTPCLAWSLLHDERGLIWGCEADTVSMLTKHILQASTGRAGDHDEPLPVPDGPGGPQARADRGLSRTCPIRSTTCWSPTAATWG